MINITYNVVPLYVALLSRDGLGLPYQGVDNNF